MAEWKYLLLAFFMLVILVVTIIRKKTYGKSLFIISLVIDIGAILLMLYFFVSIKYLV